MLVKYFLKLFFEALSNFLSRTRLRCFVSFAATLIFYQSLLYLSSTFFVFFRLRPRIVWTIPWPSVFFRIRCCFFFDELLNFIALDSFCQVLFKKFIKRRKRDLNPRAAVNDLLPFQGSPFGQLGYFSTIARMTVHYLYMILSCSKRRGWDSNPRALADKRFSRPPRYDHFDTSPRYLIADFSKLLSYIAFATLIILS